MLARHGFAYDPNPFKALQPAFLAFLASIHEECAKRLRVRLCLWKASRTKRDTAGARGSITWEEMRTTTRRCTQVCRGRYVTTAGSKGNVRLHFLGMECRKTRIHGTIYDFYVTCSMWGSFSELVDARGSTTSRAGLARKCRLCEVPQSACSKPRHSSGGRNTETHAPEGFIPFKSFRNKALEWKDW